MISFLLTVADSSSVIISKSPYTYNMRNIQYIDSQGKVLTTSLYDKGFQCRVRSNGQHSDLKNTDDHAAFGLYFSYETYATNDSGNFIINIENIKQEPVDFEFACALDVAWLDDAKSFFSNNNVYPIKDTDNKFRSFYITNPGNNHKDNKMVMNLRPSSYYTCPDYFWYGLPDSSLSEYEKRFWYKFEGDPQPYVKNDDVEISWSWKTKQILPGETVKYGFSTNFLYEHALRVSTPLERKTITTPENKAIDIIIQSEALMPTNTYELKKSVDGAEFKPVKTITNPPYYYDTMKDSFPGKPLSKTNVRYQLTQKDSRNDSMIFDFDIIYTMNPSITWQQPNKNLFYSPEKILFKDLLVKTDSDVTVTKLLINSKGETVIRESKTYQATEKLKVSYIDYPQFEIDTTKYPTDSYRLSIRCISEYGMVDETPLEFAFEIRRPTTVKDVELDAPVKIAGSSVRITGKFIDEDPKENLVFKALFGKNSKECVSQQYSTSGNSNEVPFSMDCEVPSEVKGNIEVSFFALDSKGTKLSSQTLNLRVKSKISFTELSKPSTDKFSKDEDLVFSFNINDDSNGHVKIFIDGTERNDISFQAEGKSSVPFTYTLTINNSNNLEYSSNKQHTFVAKFYDQYENKADLDFSFSFYVLNAPTISSVQMTSKQVEPGQSHSFVINVNDIDSGKMLYGMVKIGDNWKLVGSAQSNGASNQIQCTLEITKTGKYTYPICVSSNQNVASASNKEKSEETTQEFVVTKRPRVEIVVRGNDEKIFNKTESIPLELTIYDDGHGKISYSYKSKTITMNDDDSKYVVPSGQEYITKTVNLPLSNLDLEYRDGTIKLTVVVTDEYDIPSENADYSFSIKNTPKVITASPDKVLLRDTDRSIKIYVTIEDIDYPKQLTLLVKEGDYNYKSYDMKDLKRQPTYPNSQVTFTLESFDVQTGTGTNIPITVWVEDDLNEAYDSRFGESNKFTFYINKTRVPYVYSAKFPADNNFRLNSEMQINVDIVDDTNGRLQISVDGNELPVNVPYQASNGKANVETKISLNGVSVGENHRMVVMAVDEFGFFVNISKYTRSYTFNVKEPMVLSKVKLNQTTAENDDPVEVSGHVKDVSGVSTVYIVQIIDATSHITLGSTSLTNGEGDFKFNLKDLNNFLSGEHNISIYASYSDPLSIYKTSTYSEPTVLKLRLSNDPEFIVNWPQNLLTAYSTVTFTSTVTRQDLALKYTLSVKNKTYGNIRNILSDSTFSKEVSKEYSYNTELFIGPAIFTVTATTTDGRSVERTFEFTVKDRFVLDDSKTRIQGNKNYATPGSEIEIRIQYTRYYYERATTKYYLYYEFDNNKQYQGFTQDYRGKNDIFLTLTIPQYISTGPGLLPLKYWIQEYQGEYDINRPTAVSDIKTFQLRITDTPSVVPTWPSDADKSNSESFDVSLQVNDDTEGTLYFLLDDSQEPFDTLKYSNTDPRPLKKTLTLTNANYGKHKVHVYAIDEFGEKSKPCDDYEVFVRNKPTVNELQFDQEYTLLGDRASFSATLTDSDQGKKIYWFAILNGNKYKLDHETPTISNGKSQTIRKFILIPESFQPGTYTITIYCSDIITGDLPSNMNNAESQHFQLSHKITFRPHAIINSLNKYDFSDGDECIVYGNIKGDGQVKVTPFFGTKSLKDYSQTIQCTGQYKQFELRFQVSKTLVNYNLYRQDVGVMLLGPDNIASEPYKLGYDEKPVFYKNKPSIKSVSLDTEDIMINQTISISITYDDIDRNKYVHFYAYIDNENKLVHIGKGGYYSNGNENQKASDLKFKVDTTYGDHKLYIIASDRDNFDEYVSTLDNSLPYNKDIYVTYAPYMLVTKLTQKDYLTPDEKVEFQLDVKDDKTAYVNVYIDESNEAAQVVEFVSNDQQLSKKVDVDISSLKYSNNKQHHIKLAIIDSNKKSGKPYDYYFYVRNKPIIYEVTPNKNVALRDDFINVKIRYFDADDGKELYFFYRIEGENDNYKERFTSHNAENTLSTQVRIDKTIPKGSKKVYCYITDDQNFKSEEVPFTLLITDRPIITLNKPSNPVYQDGESISFSGEIESQFDVTLHYKIGEVDLLTTQKVQMKSAKQNFDARVPIPAQFTYGEYTLYIYGSDVNGVDSIVQFFEFKVRNAPKISEMKLNTNQTYPGKTISISGKAKDNDVGNSVDIKYSLDNGPDKKVQTFTSDGTEQKIFFELTLSEKISFGQHKVTVYAIDEDNYKSDEVTLLFTVYDPTIPLEEQDGGKQDTNNNKKNTKSNATLIALVVVFSCILIALVIIAVIIWKKKSGATATNNAQSSDQEDDLQVPEETMTNTATSHEVATADNPLFVEDNSDPFKDEFEEESFDSVNA